MMSLTHDAPVEAFCPVTDCDTHRPPIPGDPDYRPLIGGVAAAAYEAAKALYYSKLRENNNKMDSPDPNRQLRNNASNSNNNLITAQEQRSHSDVIDHKDKTSNTLETCPFHLTNLQTNQKVLYDAAKNLAGHTTYGIGCQGNQCHAAMMDKVNMPTVDSCRSKEEVWKEANEFLLEYYRDCHPDGMIGYPIRATEVKKVIDEKGYYFHTYEELQYGVRLAWRNSSRCIMRVQWRNIHVIDARGPNEDFANKITSMEIFNKCVDHLRSAVTQEPNGNKVIQSQITVFPQLLPGERIGRRIWNPQLLRFAGYKNPDGSILGDPVNVELTNICSLLGWNKTTKSSFDLLPLIIQESDDSSLYMAELPEDAQLMVPIHHPNYPQFSNLGIKWHAIPAISNFTLDIGGIQYPCAPFNGWYMSTEIASRNLADVQRYNLVPEMAKAMGLDINRSRDLWRDRAVIELNQAVLYSFDFAKVTIVDHHTASESFVRHYKKEMDTRGFIPADWVWLVPPLGGSETSVFHQEMINFFIKPNFLMPKHSLCQLHEIYQDKLCLTLEHASLEESKASTISQKYNRFIYIYYASETGTSESFAADINTLLERQVGADIMKFGALDECNLDEISEGPMNTTLIIIASTFGSGGPPENGASFHKKIKDCSLDLSNVDVFILGLGNSAYAKYNAFARYIKQQLESMRARIVLSGEADEKNDTIGTFQEWKDKAIEKLTIGGNIKVKDSMRLSGFQISVHPLSRSASQLSLVGSNASMHKASLLASRRSGSIEYGRRGSLTTDSVFRSSIKKENILIPASLSKVVILSSVENREACLFTFDVPIHNQLIQSMKEGDHVAIIPSNSKSSVEKILNLLGAKGDHYINVIGESVTDVPIFLRGEYQLECILRDYIDLSAAPSYSFVNGLLSYFSVESHLLPDFIKLQKIVNSFDDYHQWITDCAPSLVELLELYPSIVKYVPLNILLSTAPLITPRLYSLSSSTFWDQGSIQLTIRCSYIEKKAGKGSIPSRRGLCSEFLWSSPLGAEVRLYVSSSNDFRLDPRKPVVMIGTGTGIAPFRSFWRSLALAGSPSLIGVEAKCMVRKKNQKTRKNVILYYGCRNASDQLFKDELSLIHDALDIKIAFSRPYGDRILGKGRYVDYLLEQDATNLRRLVNKGAKIYVCGGKGLSSLVMNKLKEILGENEFSALLSSNRYMEEIF